MPHIVVQNYQFPISHPYSIGHPLTATEANILNYQRAELIRKIVNKWVNDAEEASPNPILSPAELANLSDRIAQLDSTYTFSPRSEPRKSPLEQILSDIAYIILADDGDIFATPEEVEAIKNRPDVQQRARNLLAARAGISTIEDLALPA